MSKDWNASGIIEIHNNVDFSAQGQKLLHL